MHLNFWIFSLWMVIIYVACLLLSGVTASNQYHIQTDEGPERYFRFQTDNGQFRKEKRLQDGTVIGTEAWIDAAGYLRFKDYMADKQGYRILKSKTIYVGRDTNIQDAIKLTKSTAAQSGVLVDNKVGFLVKPNSIISDEKRNNYVSTPEAPILGYLSPAEAAKLEPIPFLGFDHYPNELPSYGKGYGRSKFNDYKVESNAVKPVAALSLDIEPPVINTYRRRRPIDIASTSPKPLVHGSYSSPTPFGESILSSINDNYHNGYNYGSPNQITPETVSTLSESINNLVPIYDRHRIPDYNGIANTRNGFRYVLPHQYHEEATITSTKKAGSYGYVDPFGIRRVVYYNASPEKGFVHRNHNHYVGLGGTPYDEPQPTDE